MNVCLFADNTTMGNSICVTPHCAIVKSEATLPKDWVFPTLFVEERTMYDWTGDMMEERQQAYKRMRDVQGRRVR